MVTAAIRVRYAGRRVPLAVRDRLGQWLDDEVFASAFGMRGRPGWPPSRLAVVTVLQFTGLADFWHYAGMSWYAWGRDHAVSAESVFMVT